MSPFDHFCLWRPRKDFFMPGDRSWISAHSDELWVSTLWYEQYFEEDLAAAGLGLDF
jgi:hypothetical protein